MNAASQCEPGELVLGVDAGGTKTVAWLAPRVDASGDSVLGRGQAGPGNPRACGFEIAEQNIDAAIAAAFAAAQRPRACVAAVCLGVAGAGRLVEQDALRAWAEQARLAARVRVTHDAEPILAAAAPEHCGVALICGTGSLAWGRNAAGETARVGGWGHLLGDEGSAYAIAVAALRAATRAADGRGPATTLLPRLLEALHATEPAGLVERVYDPATTRAELAALATIVFDAAETDDVAGGIIRDAAAQLATLAETLVRRLELTAGAYVLALAGGVVTTQPAMAERITGALAASGLPPGVVRSVSDPVRGAVALARRDAGD